MGKFSLPDCNTSRLIWLARCHLNTTQITGCSSGLGRALALRLHAEGAGAGGERPYRVFASARNQTSLKELEAVGLETVQLDVTDQVGTAAHSRGGGRQRWKPTRHAHSPAPLPPGRRSLWTARCSG
jgi:hypothetical protein